MKTLKKNEEFKRVPDSTKKDIEFIDILLEDGWSYSPKKDWKEWKKQFETESKENSKKSRKGKS
jgi:hypothetical protein